MNITLAEARELYEQGGLAREIALRAFPKEEIVNNYTLMTALPTSAPFSYYDLYAKLSVVYKFISRGREVNLTSGICYVPEIILTLSSFRSRRGTYAGKVIIDGQMYSIYINTAKTIWEGKLGFENDGVWCGNGLLKNHWIFKEEGQALHFVKYFYKELITLELEDFYTVKFV